MTASLPPSSVIRRKGRFNTARLSRTVRRMFVRHPPVLVSYAVSREILSPGTSVPTPPAIYLPGSLERIEALSPWRTWDIELDLIQGRPADHAPTSSFEIHDVHVAGAYLYKGAAKSLEGFGPEEMMRRGGAPYLEIEEGQLVTTWAGSHFFGPFLQCDLALELLAHDQAGRFTMRTRLYEHAAGYRELLDLPSPPLIEYGRIRRLRYFSDFSQNAHKVERYRELRRRLRRAVTPLNRGAPGAYLARGTSGEARLIDNEMAMQEHLVRKGFVVVDPAKHSAREISERLLDVPLVISIEGSHLSHAIYSLRDRGTLLVLQPPKRFAMPYKEFTDAMDMRFAFLVGTATGTGSHFDLEDLDRLLDRLP